MKRIVKDAEPEDFSGWKARDRMAHRPNWNRLPRAVKKKVHESLMREQGYICCYCEAAVATEDSHVEHFRPVGKYPDLQLDYSNLHCSCQREPSPGEPRHCGHRKGSWFDEDLLVSPMAPDCGAWFRFTANGDIFPGADDDAAAEETIRRLGLNLSKLRALRAAAVDALYGVPKAEIGRLLGRGAGGRFLEFHTTIEQVLSA